MPNAIKFIYRFSNWEELLYVTEPENWSPNAMYQATRIFASNFRAKQVERFYKLVLLPRVREDILKNKRLHFALYQSLKKSMYKPAAFFKGILFPLCEVHNSVLLCLISELDCPDFYGLRKRWKVLLIQLFFLFNKQSRTCNLREAVIIGSVLQKVSIPILHSRFLFCTVMIYKVCDVVCCSYYFVAVLVLGYYKFTLFFFFFLVDVFVSVDKSL